jgi:hypothetical protein
MSGGPGTWAIRRAARDFSLKTMAFIYEIAKNTIRVKQSATEIPSGNLT